MSRKAAPTVVSTHWRACSNAAHGRSSEDKEGVCTDEDDGGPCAKQQVCEAGGGLGEVEAEKGA